MARTLKARRWGPPLRSHPYLSVGATRCPCGHRAGQLSLVRHRSRALVRGFTEAIPKSIGWRCHLLSGALSAHTCGPLALRPRFPVQPGDLRHRAGSVPNSSRNSTCVRGEESSTQVVDPPRSSYPTSSTITEGVTQSTPDPRKDRAIVVSWRPQRAWRAFVTARQSDYPPRRWPTQEFPRDVHFPVAVE